VAAPAVEPVAAVAEETSEAFIPTEPVKRRRVRSRKAAAETVEAVAEPAPEPVAESAPEPVVIAAEPAEPVGAVVVALEPPPAVMAEPQPEPEPDPAEISAPPVQPKRGWWRRRG
jgi:ribonuclease E